jgi:DNA uptake protein ComE-like DNA-binding protein
MKNTKEDGRKPSASFIVGAVALVFLIVGYQAALFIHGAAVTRIISNHDRPDTVLVYPPESPGTGRSGDGDSAPDPGSLQYRGGKTERITHRSPEAESIRRHNTPRRYESFKFDPNTVSIEDLMRLGFSEKQALSIDRYRQKGGRFRRKSDFARSYVVDDTVFRRLEPFISIPKIDLNKADSAAFSSLPGIGKFFSAKMVAYRDELGGYSYPEQLMDIWHFDQEKYDGLKDLITVGASEPYPLWTLPEKELAKHPYIGKRAARGIVIFRENTPVDEWTVENIIKAGILDPGLDEKLARCLIAPPLSP